MAGNQLGKSFTGAAEVAFHLTGRYPNRMPVGSGNQLAKWNGWNYFHRKEPCDNGSE
ncbi:TPA: terminase family protein [Escherichia coli]|nr:terminase family protein [Escherichia coli]HDV2697317.1 terminase family protein [Escherichia coli]HDV2736219.1 terminase family protein [Escherichia coli]HDV3322867.1 terminase family protein [Escherichia coli]HDV3329368.1 terminase family protein [Escherichia coli]